MPSPVPYGARNHFLSLYFFFLFTLVYVVVVFVKTTSMRCAEHDLKLHKETSTRPWIPILSGFFFSTFGIASRTHTNIDVTASLNN